MQNRDSVSVPTDTQKWEQEHWASPFRLRAYRTVQTGPVSSPSVHHGIFPDVYFYTQSLQRPHERRPMASRREQVSALFFVAWTQRRLTECFPWATEGPNPPKETLTFKKEFFWQTTWGSLPAGLKKKKNASNFLLKNASPLIFSFKADWLCSLECRPSLKPNFKDLIRTVQSDML